MNGLDKHATACCYGRVNHLLVIELLPIYILISRQCSPAYPHSRKAAKNFLLITIGTNTDITLVVKRGMR